MRHVQFLLVAISLIVAANSLHVRRLKREDGQTDTQNIPWNPVDETQSDAIEYSLKSNNFSSCKNFEAVGIWRNSTGGIGGSFLCNSTNLYVRIVSVAKGLSVDYYAFNATGKFRYDLIGITPNTTNVVISDNEENKWIEVQDSYQLMIYASALQQFSDCSNVFAKDFYQSFDGTMAGVVQCDGDDMYLEAKVGGKFKILDITDAKPAKVAGEGFPTWISASLMKNTLPAHDWKVMQNMAEASKNASDCNMDFLDCDVKGLNPGGPVFVCKETCPIDEVSKVAYKTMAAPTDEAEMAGYISVILTPANDSLRHILQRLYNQNPEKPDLPMPENWEVADNETQPLIEGAAATSSNFSNCVGVEVYTFYLSDSGRLAGVIKCGEVKNYVEARVQGKFNVLAVTAEEPIEVSQGMPMWMGAQLLESAMPKSAWAMMCQFLSATKNSSDCTMTIRGCSYSTAGEGMVFVCKETCPIAAGPVVAYKTLAPPEDSDGPPEVKFFPADPNLRNTLYNFYGEKDDGANNIEVPISPRPGGDRECNCERRNSAFRGPRGFPNTKQRDYGWLPFTQGTTYTAAVFQAHPNFSSCKNISMYETYVNYNPFKMATVFNCNSTMMYALLKPKVQVEILAASETGPDFGSPENMPGGWSPLRMPMEHGLLSDPMFFRQSAGLAKVLETYPGCKYVREQCQIQTVKGFNLKCERQCENGEESVFDTIYFPLEHNFPVVEIREVYPACANTTVALKRLSADFNRDMVLNNSNTRVFIQEHCKWNASNITITNSSFLKVSDGFVHLVGVKSGNRSANNHTAFFFLKDFDFPLANTSLMSAQMGDYYKAQKTMEMYERFEQMGPPQGNHHRHGDEDDESDDESDTDTDGDTDTDTDTDADTDTDTDKDTDDEDDEDDDKKKKKKKDKGGHHKKGKDEEGGRHNNHGKDHKKKDKGKKH